MSASAASKRLCVFTSALGGGGVQRSMRQLASGLAARGYTVDLVVCHGDRQLARELAAAHVNVVVLRPSWPGVGRLLALKADPLALGLLNAVVRFGDGGQRCADVREKVFTRDLFGAD